MADAYSDITYYSSRANTLRRQLRALAANDPRRPDLERRLGEMRRGGQVTRTEARDALTARIIAHATLSANTDVGELLTEHWFNHFNVDAEKVYWAAADYRGAIQRGMCGRFDQLLTTVAKHPAMLMYLDNFRSTAGAINENYARELIELHTFGDDLYRFYQQKDVVNVARVLSGWSVAFAPDGPDRYLPVFRFYSGAHDGARVRLFDTANRGIPLTLEDATGAAAVGRGEALLRYLASHPATRRNVCGKLMRKLIGEAPAELVDGCVSDAVWGANGDLGAIYRFVLTRPEMWRSMALKEKNPFELLVSAYRAVRLPSGGLEQRWIQDNVTVLARLGLLPGRIPPPTGYKDANIWISSGLLLSWNQQLFAAMPTTNLSLGSRRGTDLEAFYATRVTADPSATGLRRLGATIARDVLAYPALALSTDEIYPALLESDTSKDDRSRAPVRSYVHALLGHTSFLRK